MSDLKWKKKYEIGHPRIDFEHRIFVDLITRIYDAIAEKRDGGYLERLMYELQKYTEFHFVSEENIMYSIGYPDYDAHVEHHRELLERFSQKKMEMELGERTIEELLKFLVDWFLTHTLTEDRKIASFVHGKKI